MTEPQKQSLSLNRKTSEIKCFVARLQLWPLGEEELAMILSRDVSKVLQTDPAEVSPEGK